MDVFAAQAEWPIQESIGYVSDVLRAYDDTEQRINLRATANGGLSFRAVMLDARASARLRANIWVNQADTFLVPWWPDQRQLVAAAAAGASVLSVDTTDTDFVAGGRAILWRSETVYEYHDIDSLTDNSITLDTPLDSSWPAGALVLPLKLCRMGFSQSVQQPATVAMDIDVQFASEIGETPEHAGATPLQHDGLDVLSEMPNNIPELEIGFSRSAALLDNPSGVRAVDDHSGIATTERGFTWFAQGRTAITSLKEFIHRRKGRVNPVWIPTWRMDLPLVEDVAGGVTFDVLDIGYTSGLFSDLSRRHVAFITSTGEMILREITGAVDNGDGTETLTVSVALPALPQDTLVSFLTLVRLAEDEVSIRWGSLLLAEAEFAITEVTREVA